MKRSAMGLIYLIQGMRSAGVNVDEKLKKIGIDAALIDPQALIHRELEWHIQQYLSVNLDPHMGVRIGQHYALSGYGPFLMFLLTAPNVEHALKEAIRFQELTFNFGRLDYQIRPEILMLMYHPVKDHTLDLRSHVEISGTYKFVQDIYRLMGLPQLPMQVGLSIPPPTDTQNLQDYQEYYGEDVVFGQPYTWFKMNPSILYLNLNTADAVMHDVYRQRCKEEIIRMKTYEKEHHKVTLQIKDYLHLQMGIIPRFSEISDALKIPERTLRHQLKLANTSFKVIKEDLLKQKSQQLLQEEQYSIEQIAHVLGYAETAAFNHAFKRWYGCSPKQYQALIKPAAHLYKISSEYKNE